MQRFHAAEGTASYPSSPQSSSKSKSSRKERSKLACDQCRKRKLRCDNLHPCEPCRTKKLLCAVSSTSRPPGRPRHDEPSSPADQYMQNYVVHSSEISAVPVSWMPDVLESTTPRIVPLPMAPGTGRSDIPNHLEPLPSSTTNLSQVQQQTDEPNAHPDSLEIDAMGALFPDSAMNMDQSWEDVDFMDGLWPFPSCVSLT